MLYLLIDDIQSYMSPEAELGSKGGKWPPDITFFFKKKNLDKCSPLNLDITEPLA